MSVDKTIAYAKSRIGDNEVPSGSNRGWFWDHVRSHWGVSLQPNPWCGAFVIDAAYHGGLKLPWQFVSVNYIVQWGRARGRYHTNEANIRPGDAVIMFGGRHVELAVARGTSRGVTTIGGNTGGNEPWRGGTVAKQFRSSSQIMGYVKLYDKYPKPPAFVARKWPLPSTHWYSKKLSFAAKYRPRIHNGTNLTKPTTVAADAANVKRIQAWLKYLGYYNGPISGKFSLSTRYAVVKFQKKRNYKNPNGLVGPGTWLALQKAVYNKRY